jgi:hypothetical protein
METTQRPSQSFLAYNAYLQTWKDQHHDILDLKPVTYDVSLAQPLPSELKPYWRAGHALMIHTSCKYWQDFGTVWKLNDGQVYEVLCKNGRTHIAVFKSHDDWKRYDVPMTIRQYLDQW